MIFPMFVYFFKCRQATGKENMSEQTLGYRVPSVHYMFTFLIRRELLLLLTVPRVISFICCLLFFLETNAGFSNNDNKHATATFDQISLIWRKWWICGKLWLSDKGTTVESFRKRKLSILCSIFRPSGARAIHGRETLPVWNSRWSGMPSQGKAGTTPGPA